MKDVQTVFERKNDTTTYILELVRHNYLPDSVTIRQMPKKEDKIYSVLSSIDKTLKNQNSINEALCSENCTARWLWKSGKLKKGYQIPWEAQSINTCPENFLQHIGDPLIVTATPGLYEMKFGFYSDAQPSI